MENLICIKDSVLKFLAELPLTDILVGVVVPIVAAWISYYLAERAIRKKENNRLYIQVELIRKELNANDRILAEFISSVEEMHKAEKALEFPLIFMQNFLTEILNRLQNIKSNYMHSRQFIFEKPAKQYILAQRINALEQTITEKECQYYSDEYLDQKRKEQLSKLVEENEQLIKEFNEAKDIDIYKEFVELQKQLENLMVGDVFDKIEEREENFLLAKYIYNRIKTFNEKNSKNKEDVLELYNDLVIFNISDDIIQNDCFDYDEFQIFCNTSKKVNDSQAQLYKLCGEYYRWIALKKHIANCILVFDDKRWKENSADFVIINDREVYISLTELYEKLNISMEDDIEERYEACVTYRNEIQNIIMRLNQLEVKIERKC